MKKLNLLTMLVLLTALLFAGCASTESTESAPAEAETESEAAGEEAWALMHGDFGGPNEEDNDGVAGWNTDGGSAGGKAYFAVVDGALQVEVVRGGNETWSIGVYQSGIPMIKGKNYKVSFKAKADDDREIGALIGMNHDPYETYGEPDQYFDLDGGADYVVCEFEFKAPVNDSNAQFAFALGNVGGQNETIIYIDDVVVEID